MKPKPYRLLVVAHPDDETIFFGGLLMNLRSLPWLVICVTDGNADGRGHERTKEFKAATKLLGVKNTEHWDFLDKYPDRLPMDELVSRLQKLSTPKEIYTHGPVGEYGHPHHQDVCLAVHRAFSGKAKIFSPAWNCNIEKIIKLSPAQYKKKTQAYSKVYGQETTRFVNILPNMAVETFRQFSTKEVEAIVGFFRREKPLDAKALKEAAWMTDLFPGLRDRLDTRLF
ncbi:MAG: PIG-L family deacetylase [Bdellovibrionota bacterium]